MKEVRFHREADAEIAEAQAWYRARSEVAAQALALEIENAIKRIAESPERWSRGRRGERRFFLSRFPYSVLYRIQSDHVFVTAVAHHSWPALKLPAASELARVKYHSQEGAAPVSGRSIGPSRSSQEIWCKASFRLVFIRRGSCAGDSLRGFPRRPSSFRTSLPRERKTCRYRSPFL